MSNHLRITLVIVFSILTVSSISFASNTRHRLSYEHCVDMALKNNDQIRAAEYDINLSEAKLDQAHPRGIPIVKYENYLAPAPGNVDDAYNSYLSGDIQVFTSFKVELGTPITTFGKIKTAQELAQLGIDASWFQKQKTQDDVIYKVYQIYQGILLGKELLGLADQAERAITDKIHALEKERVLDQIQILKLKVALYEIERKVEEGKKKVELAYTALKVQTGLEEDVDLSITSQALVPISYKLIPFSYYLEQALEYRPEYKLLDTGIQAKEKQLKLEKLSPVPNLGVGGFVDIGRAPGVTGEDESTFTNPFNYTKAGVGFQLKGEFDFVKTKSKIKQQKADLLKTIYLKNAAVKGLELDLKQTYLSVIEARNLMDKAGDEKIAARQLVFLTKSNLDIGLGDKKDYLDALQSYLLFQGREFEAVYNYNVAVSELKMKTGQLYKEQRKETK